MSESEERGEEKKTYREKGLIVHDDESDNVIDLLELRAIEGIGGFAVQQIGAKHDRKIVGIHLIRFALQGNLFGNEKGRGFRSVVLGSISVPHKEIPSGIGE